ncbi:hypothetical protein QFC20_006131 [Naganishia adeliensis]|uniref:Uncharacterized protein n=1 Tax=Naganishia adeliensis TaxID=92952 RepID=A0ACC2VFS4_9TREE|nr:hypothetical protein QFC20_006131 [Naganishia adeliensis]
MRARDMVNAGGLLGPVPVEKASGIVNLLLYPEDFDTLIDQLHTAIPLHPKITLDRLTIFGHHESTPEFLNATVEKLRFMYQTHVDSLKITGIDKPWPGVEVSEAHPTTKKLEWSAFGNKENEYAIGLLGRLEVRGNGAPYTVDVQVAERGRHTER